jgi:hypothetical protein
VARVTIGFPTRVDVGVDVCVGVALGRGVCVGVAVGISVRVGVGVAVGMPLFVGVAVGGIGAGVRVSVGRTAVFVGSWVGGTRPRSSPDVHPASTDNATTETSFRNRPPAPPLLCAVRNEADADNRSVDRFHGVRFG